MNSYAENLRRSIIHTTRRFVEMADELRAKQNAANRKDIIRMAGEAGFEADDIDVWITDGYWLKQLERFAALVTAAEREAFVQIVHEMDGPDGVVPTDDLLAAIRARGEK